MIHVKLGPENSAVEITCKEFLEACTNRNHGPGGRRSQGVEREIVQNSNDWKTFEQVEKIAEMLTRHTGVEYIGTDAGSHVSPRYDVIKMPQVGDDVSYSFNGDSYPCGKIWSVSATKFKITTMTESGLVKHFYRRRKTGSWINNGTWSLISGHHSEQNPSF
jgi:hypothetical protein